MISKYERGKSNILREKEFFKKVLDSRYKDTPYSIVKEAIGHDWMIYIIENENVVYGIERTDTKKNAIQRIESKIIYNELNNQSKWHNNVMITLYNYMIGE